MELLLEGPSMCFGCSPHNPIGLKLEFTMDGDICRAYFTPSPEHQGYHGYMHGGIIAALLDESMGQWLYLNNLPSMTAEMTIRFSLAVPIDKELKIEARCLSKRKRLYEMEASLKLPDGMTLVRSTAKFLRVNIRSNM